MAVKRRRSTDVRQELLRAASYLFARRGWAGTSTKEIAARAGTYETSLYTHFGSKAGIFSTAVVEPFEQFISSFRTTLANQHSAREEVLTQVFVRDLHRALEEHREAVTAFILAMGEPEAGEALAQARTALASAFDGLHASGRARAARIGRSGPGRPLTQRLMIGLVVASSVFEPWLFSGEGFTVSADDIQEAIVDLFLNGIETASARSSAASRRGGRAAINQVVREEDSTQSLRAPGG